MKEVNASICGRENDLIAFLYGELNDVEARTFQRHMNDCAACNIELAGFRTVREAVVAWRDESLGGVSSSQITETAVTRAGLGKPSALAALREFFTLSPLWLKGAVAFASILFCLFAGLAIARLRDKPPAAIVTNPESTKYSERQLNALVDRRVQDELHRIKNPPQPVAPTPAIGENAHGRTYSRRIASRSNVANNDPSQKARRPLSRSEREQLAADLRLVSGRNDGELDLLDDRINQ